MFELIAMAWAAAQVILVIHMAFDIWYESVGGDRTWVRIEELSWNNRAKGGE